ncbi:MAG: hypothetical protein ACYS0K_20920 [Planctomycetota bacterium]|jgi:hypothetical protein
MGDLRADEQIEVMTAQAVERAFMARLDETVGNALESAQSTVANLPAISASLGSAIDTFEKDDPEYAAALREELETATNELMEAAQDLANFIGAVGFVDLVQRALVDGDRAAQKELATLLTRYGVKVKNFNKKAWWYGFLKDLILDEYYKKMEEEQGYLSCNADAKHYCEVTKESEYPCPEDQEAECVLVDEDGDVYTPPGYPVEPASKGGAKDEELEPPPIIDFPISDENVATADGGRTVADGSAKVAEASAAPSGGAPSAGGGKGRSQAPIDGHITPTISAPAMPRPKDPSERRASFVLCGRNVALFLQKVGTKNYKKRTGPDGKTYYEVTSITKLQSALGEFLGSGGRFGPNGDPCITVYGPKGSEHLAGGPPAAPAESATHAAAAAPDDARPVGVPTGDGGPSEVGGTHAHIFVCGRHAKRFADMLGPKEAVKVKENDEVVEIRVVDNNAFQFAVREFIAQGGEFQVTKTETHCVQVFFPAGTTLPPIIAGGPRTTSGPKIVNVPGDDSADTSADTKTKRCLVRVRAAGAIEDSATRHRALSELAKEIQSENPDDVVVPQSAYQWWGMLDADVSAQIVADNIYVALLKYCGAPRSEVEAFRPKYHVNGVPYALPGSKTKTPCDKYTIAEREKLLMLMLQLEILKRIIAGIRLQRDGVYDHFTRRGPAKDDLTGSPPPQQDVGRDSVAFKMQVTALKETLTWAIMSLAPVPTSMLKFLKGLAYELTIARAAIKYGTDVFRAVKKLESYIKVARVAARTVAISGRREKDLRELRTRTKELSSGLVIATQKAIANEHVFTISKGKQARDARTVAVGYLRWLIAALKRYKKMLDRTFARDCLKAIGGNGDVNKVPIPWETIRELMGGKGNIEEVAKEARKGWK